jgi:hypothetical protein
MIWRSFISLREGMFTTFVTSVRKHQNYVLERSPRNGEAILILDTASPQHVNSASSVAT